MVAPRAKSVCSFVSLVQTNLGTKSVCSLVTKRLNGFGYTNLDHSRSHKIEKKEEEKKISPFSYKFFVPIRVGLFGGKWVTYETTHPPLSILGKIWETLSIFLVWSSSKKNNRIIRPLIVLVLMFNSTIRKGLLHAPPPPLTPPLLKSKGRGAPCSRSFLSARQGRLETTLSPDLYFT